MKSARPKKLRNGTWGAIVDGKAAPGESIQITTKAGKSWEATVAKVIWSGDGVSIVATESSGKGSSGSKSRKRVTPTGCACGSVEEYMKESDCWSCKHDAT